MADRVAVVGGNLHIDSRPHEGTRVTLAIPIPIPGLCSLPSTTAPPSAIRRQGLTIPT